MKLRMGLFMLVFSVWLLAFGSTPIGAEPDHSKPEYQDVELNKQQTKELKMMYEDMVNKRKGIIAKYQEYGVLSKEDATKMTDQLDLFMKKMENDGFIPKWQVPKKRHKQE